MENSQLERLLEDYRKKIGGNIVKKSNQEVKKKGKGFEIDDVDWKVY